MEEARIWETFNCKDIEEIIKGNLRTIDEKFAQITASFVTNGYYLRRQHDEKMYVAEGYDSFEEYVKAVYGKSRSWAKRMMQINEKFSVGGNDPRIDKRYVEYSVSQLQEMLYLEEDQLEHITPDMTIKEIREVRKPEKKLVKPDEEQRKYLDAFARRFIDCKHDWLLQDFQNRVMHVDKSPVEIKKHLGADHRTWHFATDNGTAHINLFDDYVQLWDERSVCLGNFDWFYFASAIQRMWNIVAMENAQKKQETDAKCATSHKSGVCIHRPEYACTLPEASKLAVGDGIDCNKKCCWDCLKRMECGYRCNGAAGHPIEEAQIPGQMNVEDYPELLPEPEETGINTSNDEDNVVIEHPEIVINQPESVTEDGENVIDAEYLEVKEEQPKSTDAMLTYLVEACIEELDFDAGFEETEDIEELHDGIYDELFGMSIRFHFNDTEFRADFYGEISIYYADTEFELCTNYSWDQFFEELERIADIGERYAAENAEMEEPCCQETADPDELTFSEITIRDYLEEEERKLAEYVECDQKEKGFPQRLLQKQQMLVKALRLLVEHEADQDNVDEPEEQEELEPVQPELPVLKNNDQRKKFLENYQTWPVWFTVPEASEVYHRFNLPDGSSIVICEYHMWLEWKEKYSDENPDSIGTREYLLKPGYRYLQNCHTNSTALVEHLKNIQKGEKK